MDRDTNQMPQYGAMGQMFKYQNGDWLGGGRYRMRFYNKTSVVGSPWYVPGYGKNDTHSMGATFNLILDI